MSTPITILGYCCGMCGGSVEFRGSQTHMQAQQIFTLGNAKPVASTHESVIELEVMCLDCGVLNPDLTTLKSSPTRPMNSTPVRPLPVDEAELTPRQRRKREKELKRQRDRALPDILRIRDELQN